MTADGDERDDPGLPGLYQGHAAGDLGRDHEAGVDASDTATGESPSTTSGRAASTGRIAPAEMQAMGMPEVVVDGEVIEADPPRKLVQTWRFLWSEEIKAEGPTRVTFDIEEDDGGVTRLTVTHELENAPITAATGGQRGPGCTGRRRLELDPQRPQDAARDRQAARELTSVMGGGRREPGLHLPIARARPPQQQVTLAHVARERAARSNSRVPRRTGRA